VSNTVLDLLTLVRWLLWVIAAAVALHACYVLSTTVVRARRASDGAA
jgi:hypothetical protein